VHELAAEDQAVGDRRHPMDVRSLLHALVKDSRCSGDIHAATLAEAPQIPRFAQPVPYGGRKSHHHRIRRTT
jgi:hypothetical protein